MAYKTFLSEHEKYISTLDEIFQVCIYGNVDRLRALLSIHQEKTHRFSLGMNSLRMTGSVVVEVASETVDAAATSVKKQSWSHCTLVHLAARFNQVDVLEMLLKDFIGPHDTLENIINIEDDIQSTPLFHAVTAGAVDAATFLCSFTNIIKINTKDTFDYSPLWYALNRKDFEMADMMLMFGADMFFKIHGGESYLHRACENNDLELTKYILMGSSNGSEEQKTKILEDRQALLLRSDQKHQNPIFNAIRGYEDYLKKKKANSSMDMTEQKQEQVLDFLLDFFQQKNPSLLQKALEQTNHYGHTVIHHCAERDAFQPLLKLVKYYDNDDKLKQMLNEKDRILGSTALHIAVMTSHFDIFKLLINSREVDVNIPNQQGDLPLHIAIRQKKLRMVKQLYHLYTQNDLEMKNNQSFSSLKLAKRLSINLRKLAECSNIEDIEKEIQKEKPEKQKWWYIFKTHKNETNVRKNVKPQESQPEATENTSTSNLTESTASLEGALASLGATEVRKDTVPLVHWSTELTLGVGIIDQQHHALVDIINKLIQLLFGDGQQDSTIPDRSCDEWILGYVLGALLEYTEFHFETEEKLMKKYMKSLPEGFFDDHHQEHVEFTTKVKKLHQEYLDT